MDNVISSAMLLLLGAVVGGLAKAVQDEYSKRQDARVVRAALRAELSVLVDGIRSGNFVELVDRWITQLSDLTHPVGPADFFDAPVSQTPFPVFAAHCSKVGLLGDAAEVVVKTYLLAESVTVDLRYLPERHKQHPLTRDQLIRDQLISFHEGMKRTFEGILTSENLAIEQLRRH